MKRKLRVVVLSVLVTLLAGPAWGQSRFFRVTDENGGELTGVVSSAPLGSGGQLVPQAVSGNAGLVYLTGTGTTGSDGSVGALLSRIGLTCTSLQFVTATPHYASGQARFAMIGGRDRFGFSVWVGQADGLGLNGAGFDFMAGCVGSVSGM